MKLCLCGKTGIPRGSNQAAFNTGEMQLFQVLFARQRSNEVAWTRAYLYEPVAD